MQKKFTNFSDGGYAPYASCVGMPLVT